MPPPFLDVFGCMTMPRSFRTLSRQDRGTEMEAMQFTFGSSNGAVPGDELPYHGLILRFVYD